jgi:hypothetical protein
MLDKNHEQVLQTMIRAGLLTKQAAKSIRGQLYKMDYLSVEAYLKKIIRRKGSDPNAGRPPQKTH